MRSLIMKGILILAVLTMFFALPGTKIIAQTELYIPVLTALTGGGTDPLQPVSNLLDNDLSTGWGLNVGATEAWAELDLAKQALVYGLEINGALNNTTELMVEYQRDGQWIPFLTGNYNAIPAGGVIDLSYDRVVTGAIRLHLTGRNIHQSRLTEVRIIGTDVTQLLHRIQPKNVIASENTSPTSPAEFLTDGNTYTRWQIKPSWYPGRPDSDLDDLFKCSSIQEDTAEHFKGRTCQYGKYWSNRGEVLFELDAVYTVKNINLYLTKDTKGEILIEIPAGKDWRLIGRMLAGQPEGWYRLDLSNDVISTDKVLLTLSGAGDPAGGIAEVEIWGSGSYQGNRGLSLLRGSRELTQPLNFQFNLSSKELPNNNLELAFRGNLNEPLAIDLNDIKLKLDPIIRTTELTIYSCPLSVETLRDGANFVRIRPLAESGILLAANITQKSQDGEVIVNPTGLNNGLLLTPEVNKTEMVIPLNPKTLVEEATVFTKDNIPLQLIAQGSGGSQALSQSGPVVGGIGFSGPVTADELRVENPSGSPINEVRILGSQVTDRAPIVRILWPGDGEVIDFHHGNKLELIGFVDNPEAVVKVNGLPVYQNGHYFKINLQDLQVKLWEIVSVTAVARDPQGRESSRRIEFVYGELPVMTLDQDDQLSYTDQSTTVISGTIWVSSPQVMINGQTVPVTNHKFSASVPLEEGLNRIEATCTFSIMQGKKQISQSIKREVVRNSEPIKLMIDSPLPEAYLNAGLITINGTVTGLQPIRVTVNGYPATVNGMYYQAKAIPLKNEGKNLLTVTATDGKGRSVTKQLTVIRDTKAPLLTQITPVNAYLTSNNTVNVTGKASDTNTYWVYINGRLTDATAGSFSAWVDLSEGSQQITIKAVDIAGNCASVIINVTADFTPPLPFVPEAKPDGWTNNNRPVITFAATDKVSGIDHYELAIDDGAFSRVTSPYKLPALKDGEHLITVKAVDKVGWETTGATKVYIDTTPPLIKEFKAIPGNKKIIVSWKTDDQDVKTYIVKRLPAFKYGSKKEFGPEVHEFVDTEVENRRSYKYSIQAVDHVGNISPVIQALAVKPGIAETVVKPSEETKIEYENVVVGIPSGALPQAKTITVMELDQNQAKPLLENSKALNISPVYSFNTETTQGAVDQAGVKFEKPVLVGIHFDLKDAYSILKKSNLRAYYYNYKAGNWEVIPESYVDGEKNIVYFFTKHFSMFSIQASVAAPTSPEQISNMGVSPGKAYYQNNQVSISYGGGTTNVTAKDFVLPGRGGLDLTISRTYDSGTAQSDWGIDEKNVFQAACGFVDFGNAFFSYIASLIAAQIDRYLSEPGGSCGFGRGWRMNFVWVEKNDNGQFVHLPGGSMKKINWTMNGSGWGGQGHGVFECHAGEHFILEQNQEFVSDVYSEAGIKLSEKWRTNGFTLTTKDGTRYYMDGDGKIKKIVNRLGTSEINFYYRDDQKLDYIIDSTGRRIQFSYQGAFVSSISGAGKTVNYYYDNDLQELKRVVDGGLQETRYDYSRQSLRMGSQTVSLMSIITNILSQNWVGLFTSLLPVERSDDVYYLDKVTTPFQGEYRITYEKYNAIRYGKVFAGFSIMGYEFCKATRFQELGSAYVKDVNIEYNLFYTNDQPPLVFTCDVIEGKSIFRPDGRKRTHMLFDRYSNSVDQDTSMLKMQTVTGEEGRIISANMVDEFDKELEAPTKVVDEKNGQRTVQEFKYDNWGNIIWQKNSHTKVEAFYTYANTGAPPITNGQAITSPYGSQTLDGNIHDAKTGELVINYNGANCIPQQTCYKYNSNGNLLEKAVRSKNGWPLRTKYQYDSYGNIVTMTSPSGVETYYEYSADYQHALLTKVTLSRLTDADGRMQNGLVLKELGYDPQSYRKRWEKDARGYVTEYQYDVLGREVKTVLPDDDDDLGYRPTVLTGAIERSGFRENNPVQQVIYRDGDKKTTVIDPLGNQTDYIYDSFEHLVEIVKYKKNLFGGAYAYSRVQVKYDNEGNIGEIVSPEGYGSENSEKYTTTYQYDEVNRLTKINYPKNANDELNPCKVYYYDDVTNEVLVTDENENKTIIRKDPVDRVIEQVAGSQTASQVSTKYTYDSLGNKTSETIDDTITTEFVYDDQNHLIQKILPSENVLNDPDGQPVKKSPIYRYEYDAEGNLIKEISPLGRIITHAYDEMNREIRTETQFTGMNGSKKTVVTKTFYDLAGNKVKTVDPNGKTTEFTYTSRGWLQSQKDPLGGITSFSYDKVGNKTSETDPRGNAPGAPANSYTAWYYYDELYRLVKGVLPDMTPPANPDNPGDNPVVNFEYDRNGNCVKEVKPNGQVIEYTYNGRNWQLSQTQKLGAKTYTTRFEYYGNGNKRYVYDNKNNKTEYLYDPLNRLELEIYPEGNTVQYIYDNRGNKHIVRDGQQNQTTYNYDNLNRLYQVIDADNKITTNWYNEEGRLTKTVSPTGLVTKICLNEIGLPLEVVDSLGGRRYFDYDAAGNTIYKKDPRGTETRFVYDDLYRVLQQNLQNGSRSQSLTYEYDPAGNVKKASNGRVDLIYNDADTGYISDPFNRVQKVKQLMPDRTSYVTQYRYDLMGQMTGIRYPNSTDWLEYQYDQMGRLAGIPGFAGNKADPGFVYDDNSALQMIKTDNGITTTIPDVYGRDKNGRIKEMSVTKRNGAEVLHLSYDYDKANNIVRRNDNIYVYDKLNRLEKAAIYGAFEDNFTKADMLMGKADQDYEGKKNSEEDVTDQTQIKLDYSARSLIFDLQIDAENISKVELTPEITGHRVPVDQLEIYYKRWETDFAYTKVERNAWSGSKDAQGRIAIKFKPVINAHLLKIHCNYDDLDYLQMSVDRSEFFNSPEKLVTVYQKIVARTETYTYDGLGNRLSERILLRKEYGWDYTYYPNSNRLKAKVKNDGSEKFEYVYDANGNLVSKKVMKDGKIDTWEYAYDLLNQLEQVKKNGQVVSSYVYDPNGFRVEKQGSKGKIHYVPLLNGEVGYRKEFSGSKEYSFIYVGGQHLARVNGVVGGSGKKFYYHNDHLGTALAIMDEYGNKVVERDFAPFGERINTDIYDETNRDLDEDDSGFTGKDWDEDVGLYYYNARWYDPGVGRFIIEDSVVDSNNQGNAYVYVANNPVNNIDPTGHWAVNVNWGNFLKTAITKAIFSLLPSEVTDALGAMSAFKGLLKGIDNSKWAKFLRKYTSMNETDFKEYLKSEGINYEFNENNTSDYVFDNSEGQTALDRKQFTNGENRALKGDEKLAAFEAMKGNIKGFLENNPGLSLEQVRGIFDSAVISTDQSWGFGKNEFRFEGRGSKFEGIYDAEAIIMDQGTVKGVFTRASTLPDPEYKGGTIKQGIYDYEVGLHPRGDTDRAFSEPIENATSKTYAGKQYIALNLYNGGGFKDENRALPTEYPNKVNNNQYIMLGGNSHAGFTSSKGIFPRTGAEGCQTIYWPDYYRYISLYSSGERGKFVIIR